MVGFFLFSISVLVCSLIIYKSSRLQICSSKQIFLKLGKFQRKAPVLECLYNKVAGSQARNVIKKRLQKRCFPVKFAKFLRTPFSRNNSSSCF